MKTKLLIITMVLFSIIFSGCNNNQPTGNSTVVQSKLLIGEWDWVEYVNDASMGNTKVVFTETNATAVLYAYNADITKPFDTDTNWYWTFLDNVSYKVSQGNIITFYPETEYGGTGGCFGPNTSKFEFSGNDTLLMICFHPDKNGFQRDDIVLVRRKYEKE